MTNTSPTNFDDIADAISDLATVQATDVATIRSEMIDLNREAIQHTADMITESQKEVIAKIDNSFAMLLGEIRLLNRQQGEANTDIKQLTAASETNTNDIHELYEMIADLQIDVKKLSADERRRLADLEAFALQVAEKTGIPFNPKSKRRS